MALMEFEDLPNTDTPINAQNLNYNFNELKTNFINVGMNGDYNIATTNTMEDVPFTNILNSQGSKLSVSNGKILIGEGVSKIKVTLDSAWIKTEAGGMTMYIFKNDTRDRIVTNYASKASFAFEITESNWPMDVQEGDLIGIKCYGTAGDRVYSARSHLYIEVLG